MENESERQKVDCCILEQMFEADPEGKLEN